MSWLPSSANVQEVYDRSGRALSSGSDTAHLDVRLLVNMHGQFSSLLQCCSCSVPSQLFHVS